MKKLKLILAVLTIGVVLSACNKNQPTEKEIVNNYKDESVLNGISFGELTGRTGTLNGNSESEDDPALVGLSVERYANSIGCIYLTGKQLFEKRNIVGTFCILDHVEGAEGNPSIRKELSILNKPLNINFDYIDGNNIALEFIENDTLYLKYYILNSKVYLNYKIGQTEENICINKDGLDENEEFISTDLTVFFELLLDVNSGMIGKGDFKTKEIDNKEYKLYVSEDKCKFYMNKDTSCVDIFEKGKTKLNIQLISSIETPDTLSSAKEVSVDYFIDSVGNNFINYLEAIDK